MKNKVPELLDKVQKKINKTIHIKTDFTFSVWYLLPIILTLCVCLHFSYKANWFWNDPWSYAETSFFALVLGLCNSIPFIFRVLRTKDTRSFSTLTLICSAITGVLGCITQTYSCVTSTVQPESLKLCRWIPDMIVAYVGVATALGVLAYKIYNSFKYTDENLKIVIHSKKLTLAVIAITCLAIVGLTITLYFHLHTDLSKKTLWVSIISTTSACISMVAMIPFVVKVIVTHNVYSISLFSKISLLCAMVVWTILDVQTVFNVEHVANYIPRLVADGFTILWTIIIIAYKVKYNKVSEKNS